MAARTRLNVKLLRTLPVLLSHHYAYSAFPVNKFTAQNIENMQNFLQSVLFQSNDNRPSDIVIIEIFSFLGQINLTSIFTFFHQNTEQIYLSLTTHKHPVFLSFTSSFNTDFIWKTNSISSLYSERINPNSPILQFDPNSSNIINTGTKRLEKPISNQSYHTAYKQIKPLLTHK